VESQAPIGGQGGHGNVRQDRILSATDKVHGGTLLWRVLALGGEVLGVFASYEDAVALLTERHAAFIAPFRRPAAPDRARVSVSRRSYCWKCKEAVSSSANKQCEDCGWLICSCGACGCGRAAGLSRDR